MGLETENCKMAAKDVKIPKHVETFFECWTSRWNSKWLRIPASAFVSILHKLASMLGDKPWYWPDVRKPICLSYLLVICGRVYCQSVKTPLSMTRAAKPVKTSTHCLIPTAESLILHLLPNHFLQIVLWLNIPVDCGVSMSCCLCLSKHAYLLKLASRLRDKPWNWSDNRKQAEL